MYIAVLRIIAGYIFYKESFVDKLTVHPLSYSDDLINQYQTLSHLPGFILLESSDKQRGRYDIVTAMPYDEFKIMSDSSDINEAFSRFQRMLPKTHSSLDFPFQGGAMGYMAYDFGAVLAGIRSPVHPLLQDIPLIDMRFYDWAIIADHKKKQVHLIAAHQQPETAALIKEILGYWERKPLVYQPFKLQQTFRPVISKLDYQQSFQAIHQALTQGRAYQVNYTQPFIGQYSGDSWDVYKRIRRSNPVPFAVFLRGADFEILSFSPERFLSMDNALVQASPIKGTSIRSNDPKIDEHLRASLVLSAKDRAENVMIVDLLRNDLGKIAKPGSVRVTALCEVMSFSAVHHLVSNIEAICIDGLTPTQVFAACFPGGSITGAPKREAMYIISEQERFGRGVYCGSIGYFSSHGRFDSNIAIRTITATKNALYMAAGGGIVIDSTWEDEYKECYTKIEAILSIINT